MGLVNSHLKNKRQNLINQVDTLNQSLEFLEKLENRKTKDISSLENSKNKIIDGIEKMETIINKRKKEYQKTKDTMECNICMERKINCVLVPCGHIYCSDCVVSSNICPHCRTPYTDIQKLFFI